MPIYVVEENNKWLSQFSFFIPLLAVARAGNNWSNRLRIELLSWLNVANGPFESFGCIELILICNFILFHNKKDNQQTMVYFELIAFNPWCTFSVVSLVVFKRKKLLVVMVVDRFCRYWTILSIISTSTVNRYKKYHT